MAGRLSSLSKELAFDPPSEPSSTRTSSQNGLKVLVETLKEFFPQYYGVEWIKETARYVANLAQVNSQYLSPPGQESMTDWSQILESQPTSYLRMVWTVDLCISKGRLPEDRDFPTWLRGQLTVKKPGDYNSQGQRSPLSSSVTDSTRLDGNIAQIMDFVPSLSEFNLYQNPLSEGYSSSVLRKECVDAARPGIFEDLRTPDTVSAGKEYLGHDLDRLEMPCHAPHERSVPDLLAWDTGWL